ncbi:hypothetical protein [Streptomyces sp. NPDC020681]|uniref:hypothetical protein n=1 Tax=Streptomyces sp. NPDC020681 TaxID=3365083 RepID=UPI0037A955FF
MGALPAHLDRMRWHPDIAGRVLRLEYTAVALNPNARLFGKRSLLEQFDPARADDQKVWKPSNANWPAPGPCTTCGASSRSPRLTRTARAPALRSVERVDVGRPDQLRRWLTTISDHHSFPVENDPRFGRTRVWLRHRRPTFPTAEELFVTRPRTSATRNNPAALPNGGK